MRVNIQTKEAPPFAASNQTKGGCFCALDASETLRKNQQCGWGLKRLGGSRRSWRHIFLAIHPSCVPTPALPEPRHEAPVLTDRAASEGDHPPWPWGDRSAPPFFPLPHPCPWHESARGSRAAPAGHRDGDGLLIAKACQLPAGALPVRTRAP